MTCPPLQPVTAESDMCLAPLSQPEIFTTKIAKIAKAPLLSSIPKITWFKIFRAFSFE